jgi:hypothetical protein
MTGLFLVLLFGWLLISAGIGMCTAVPAGLIAAGVGTIVWALIGMAAQN